MKHLVLLGGGPAHLRVLHETAASPLPGTQITFVAPYGRHVFPSMVAGWVSGRHKSDDVSVPFARIAQRGGATLVDSDAVALDASARKLTLANGHTIAYDALSIDLPATPDRDEVAGARENALFARPHEHFMRLWGALVALTDEQALSIVVVGADVAAVELALAVHVRLGKRARVALVTHGGAPVPFAPPGFQQRVRKILKAGGVTLFEDRCEAIFGNQMLLASGMRLACDAPLVALTPGAPRWFPDSGLTLGERGLVLTGDTCQSTSHPEVFAVGELAEQAGLQGHDAAASNRGLSLAVNLRRFVGGGPLEPVKVPAPQVRWLDAGHGVAWAHWKGFTVGGRWVGWLKDRAERRAMADAAGGMPLPALLQAGPATVPTPVDD